MYGGSGWASRGYAPESQAAESQLVDSAGQQVVRWGTAAPGTGLGATAYATRSGARPAGMAPPSAPSRFTAPSQLSTPSGGGAALSTWSQQLTRESAFPAPSQSQISQPSLAPQAPSWEDRAVPDGRHSVDWRNAPPPAATREGYHAAYASQPLVLKPSGRAGGSSAPVPPPPRAAGSQAGLGGTAAAAAAAAAMSAFASLNSGHFMQCLDAIESHCAHMHASLAHFATALDNLTANRTQDEASRAASSEMLLALQRAVERLVQQQQQPAPASASAALVAVAAAEAEESGGEAAHARSVRAPKRRRRGARGAEHKHEPCHSGASGDAPMDVVAASDAQDAAAAVVAAPPPRYSVWRALQPDSFAEQDPFAFLEHQSPEPAQLSAAPLRTVAFLIPPSGATLQPTLDAASGGEWRCVRRERGAAPKEP